MPTIYIPSKQICWLVFAQKEKKKKSSLVSITRKPNCLYGKHAKEFKYST